MQEKCVKFASHNCVAELLDPHKGVVKVENEAGSIINSYHFYVNLNKALEQIPEFRKNFEGKPNTDYMYYLECTGAGKHFELSMLAVIGGTAIMKSHLDDHIKIFVLPYSFEMPIGLVKEIVDNFTAHQSYVNELLLIPNPPEDADYYKYYKQDRLAFKRHKFNNYYKVVMGKMSEESFFEGALELINKAEVVELDVETANSLMHTGLVKHEVTKPIKVLKVNNVYFNPQSEGEPVFLSEEELQDAAIKVIDLKTSNIFKAQ